MSRCHYVITTFFNVVVIMVLLPVLLPKLISTNAFLNLPLLVQPKKCQLWTLRQNGHHEPYQQCIPSSLLRYAIDTTILDRSSLRRLQHHNSNDNQKYRIFGVPKLQSTIQMIASRDIGEDDDSLRTTLSNSDRITTTTYNNHKNNNNNNMLYDLYTNVAVLDPDWFREYIINIVGTNDAIVNHDFLIHVGQQQKLQYQQEEERQIEDNSTNQDHNNIVNDIVVQNTTTIVDTLHITTQINKSTEKRFVEEEDVDDDVENHSPITVIDSEIENTSNDEIIDFNLNSSLTIENNTSIQQSSEPYMIIDSAINNVTTTTLFISELENDENIKVTQLPLTENKLDLNLEPIRFTSGNTTNEENVTGTTNFTFSHDDNVQLETNTAIPESFHETLDPFSIQSTTQTNTNNTNISVILTNNDEYTKNNTIDTTETVSQQQLPSSSKERRIVLYAKDNDDDNDASSEENNWETVDISILLNLGYTENEIRTLQPTALHVIVSNQLQKPRTGIPKRWLQKAIITSMDNVHGTNVNVVDEVQIVNESLMDEILKKPKSKSSRISNSTDPFVAEKRMEVPPRKGIATSPDDRNRQRTDMKRQHQQEQQIEKQRINDDYAKERVGPSMKQQQQQEQQTEQRRVNDYEKERVVPSIEHRRRRRSQQEPQSSSERQIYSGRPTSKRRLNDDTTIPLPPPPKSSFWPDVETFQKLLRDEASFRLRILGSDWTNIVKEEIDWRNELYTNWIWTLHNGIGEPFVQSRSDRIRRQHRQQQQRSRNTEDKSTSQRGRR
jgi:hypothetical protein